MTQTDVTPVVEQKPKILRVACDLAPVSGNPGLFWIGWTRPLADADFRQLRRCMHCWRAPDLEKNGTPGLDEGWRITGEGLEQAAMLGYQIVIDGVDLPATSGSFRAGLVHLLETAKTFPAKRETGQEKETPAPTRSADIPCELAHILVKFLHPEIAILGADLVEYGPFRRGEVAAIPFVHAAVFIQNGAAEMFGG